MYPKIVFEISTDPTNILKNSLKQGKIDFIIAKFPLKMKDEFEYKKIGEMHDIFIVSKDYQELIGERLTINELQDYPLLLQKRPSSSRDYIEKFCEDQLFKINRIMEIASSNLLIEFTKIGYGIGVVTKEYITKELKKKELYELNVTPSIPKRDFGIIILKTNYLSVASKKFLEMLLNKSGETRKT